MVASQLSNDDLKQMLELVKDADSVELKLTIHESARARTMKAFGVDPLDAQIRQVFFFDTPELSLNAAGLVVRARRRQGEEGDTVVKLRPVVPNHLPEDLRTSSQLQRRGRRDAGGFRVLRVVQGCGGQRGDPRGGRGWRLDPQALLEGAAARSTRTHAPDGVELDSLSVLGPIPILKLKIRPEGFERRLVGELWLYPDGSQIVELSTKCRPDEAFQVAAEARSFLHSHGVDLTGEQQTKTKTALEFFSDATQEA